MISRTTDTHCTSQENESTQHIARPDDTVQTSELVRRKRLNFHDDHRTAHVQALYEWLPEGFAAAPNIDWTKVPSLTIGYLVNTVGKNPEAPYLALAVGAMVNALGATTLRTQILQLNVLLREIRQVCGVKHFSELSNRQIWISYIEQMTMTRKVANQLHIYSSTTDVHLRFYVENLDEVQRAGFQQYALPPLPRHFLQKYAIHEARTAEGMQRRKEQADVLVPLHPVLVQLIQFRKQAAQRLLQTFEQVCQQAMTGQVSLPHKFVHENTIPTINRHARTVAEVEIVGRSVQMHLTLWDRRSWVLHHQDRYLPQTISHAEKNIYNYRSERNSLFLQFHGQEEDLLWFGMIVKHFLLQNVKQSAHATSTEREVYQQRLQMVTELKIGRGYACQQTGLLSPGYEWNMWARVGVQPGEMVFEPTSLYRGVLYGAALATMALTNGSRLSELLQVSDERWDTIAVDQLKDGHLTGKQTTLIVQRLLPKGAQTEAQRQLFPMSKQAVRLLKEIYEGLVATYGEVPVVAPSRDGSKYENLKPERYLFQWDARPDGRFGILTGSDVSKLLRFVLHGLEMTTAKGEPILVSSHLLRHVTASYARHYQHVPPEAIALLLHHRLERDSSAHAFISTATRYYSQAPERERLSALHALQLAFDEISATYAMQPPTERDLEQMEEDLRIVFERWGTILPTAFGFCGCPGLCIRGDNRALCIGCPFLVVDPTKMEATLKWRNAYARLADELEAEGNGYDARQKRRLVRQLDDHINVMRLQQQAEVDGRRTPGISSFPVLLEKETRNK